MREDFGGQSRHVIYAAVCLRSVPMMISTADPFLSTRDTKGVLTGEASGGLARAQRHTWKCRDTVDIVIDFVRHRAAVLDI